MSVTESFVTIRGRQLDLNNLVDQRLYDENYLLSLRNRLQTAQPFQHLVEDGWFNPILLEMVSEEFEQKNDPAWMTYNDPYQNTHRWVVGSKLAPASHIYFSVINSGWFVRMIGSITGVPDLLADVHLYGGGLHETKPDGRFGIHRDFDRHARTGLHNEMVIITYLNKHWQPEWNGALELWDATGTKMVKSVEPEFGRTILMRHSDVSYHGHPQPLTPPEGVKRRSLAAYYYSNRFAKIDREKRETSKFLFMRPSDRARRIVKAALPPFIWDLISSEKKYRLK